MAAAASDRLPDRSRLFLFRFFFSGSRP